MNPSPPIQYQSPDLLKRAPKCRTEAPDKYVWVPPPFRFALAFCDRDHERALDLLVWMMELGPVDREIVLFYDKGTSKEVLDPIVREARFVFSSVKEVVLAKSHVGWPGCNNFVWYHMANYMGKQKRAMPWLLLETDLAPCRPDWVQVLEDEYTKAGKPFMGSWVEYYDIMNGAGVYPPDVRPWCPEFFAGNPTLTEAYDCAIAPHIIWFTHNATHLMPHIWFTRSNGRPGGLVSKLPEWTEEMVEWVCNHNAVLVHRCKDESLIRHLRARRQRAIEYANSREY